MISRDDFKDYIHGYIAASVHLIKSMSGQAPGEGDFVDFVWRICSDDTRIETFDLTVSMKDELGADHAVWKEADNFEFRKLWTQPKDDGARGAKEDDQGRIVLAALVRARRADGEIWAVPVNLPYHVEVQQAIGNAMRAADPDFDQGMMHLTTDADGSQSMRVGEHLKQMSDEAIDREVDAFKGQLDNIFGGGGT